MISNNPPQKSCSNDPVVKGPNRAPLVSGEEWTLLSVVLCVFESPGKERLEIPPSSKKDTKLTILN